MAGKLSSSPSFREWVLQDWAVNAGARDSQVVALFIRVSQWFKNHGGMFGRLVCNSYRLLCPLLLKVDVPPEVQIGPRLRIFHPMGIVFHPDVVMGSDCTIRHNVTIGNVVDRDGNSKGSPRIGNRVEFGAGAMVLGNVQVKDGSQIGALALVLEDVPRGGVAVGNPARTIRVDETFEDSPESPYIRER